MGTIQHQLIGQLKEVNFKILAQREQTIVAGSLPFTSTMIQGFSKSSSSDVSFYSKEENTCLKL